MTDVVSVALPINNSHSSGKHEPHTDDVGPRPRALERCDLYQMSGIMLPTPSASVNYSGGNCVIAAASDDSSGETTMSNISSERWRAEWRQQQRSILG